MEGLIEFVNSNYTWILTITIILLFALIGYIYDTKRNKNRKSIVKEDELDENMIKDFEASANKSLQEIVNTTAHQNEQNANAKDNPPTTDNNQDNTINNN